MASRGRYIKDIVYGANDGIITTFAIVAGVAGADIADPRTTIVLLGIANVFADGFSMAASNYLGSRSERDVAHREWREETEEIEADPDEEQREMSQLLAEAGYSEADANVLSRLMFKNRSFFTDLVLHEEFDVSTHDRTPLAAGPLVTFVAFVGAGVLPILPFFFFSGVQHLFLYSVFSTGLVLAVLGILRAWVTRRSFLASGIETLLIGGTAAAIAYVVGALLQAALRSF